MGEIPKNSLANEVRCVANRPLPLPPSGRVLEACRHLVEKGVPLYTPPSKELKGVLISSAEKPFSVCDERDTHFDSDDLARIQELVSKE